MGINFKRLEELADLLDTVDKEHRARKEPTYDQSHYFHPCGTPSCALGHWAAAHPRRWRVRRSGYDGRRLYPLLRGGNFADSHLSSVMHEFGLNSDDVDMLFGHQGCNKAKTGKQAARFIRKFIQDHG